MSQINKRLDALEQRVQVAPAQPRQIIGTALAVTANEPHTTTENNIVTFHSHTLKAAYAMREVWLDEQKNTVVLTSPFDSGDRVLEVLAEKHGADWLADCAVEPDPVAATMTDNQLAAVIWKDIKNA
ncbi:MAG: hypothetical protein RBR22_13750 [Desulfuromonas sp.]|nr:hypothetical protein [Desulfuromonas sp.]